MQRVEAVVLAIVVNPAHAVGAGEDAGRCVGDDGIVAPGALPELVDDLHVVLGLRVAVVMRLLAVAAHALGGAVEIAGDDVPADPPSVRWSSVDMRRAKVKGGS